MPLDPPPSLPTVSESWLSAEPDESSAGQGPARHEPDAMLGATLLDTYKVQRLMAEGGMGRIYEAHHTRITEKRFAIKVLRPEFVNSPQIRARFEREMQAVARVTHPGVLSIVDVGTTGQGWSFMVSEHLGGLDLLAYLRRFGALQNDRVVQMGCRIAEALEATHAQGVIHRDVKPSNVFLLGAFEPLGPEWDAVKLIDFGLSRFVHRNDELSKTGIVMGTPAYMAPEQARGARTDHLTDVYGVGAVLYAAATGVPPFREQTQQQTLMAAMNRDPVRPRELNPRVSEALEVVIQRAMSKRPEERHRSMSALRLALSNLEHGENSVRFRPQRGVSGINAGNARSVRLRFVALGTSSLLLALTAMASAVVGFSALSLDTLIPTAAERALLALALGATIGLLAIWLQRTGRSIWGNTAKLLDRLPRLRAPLLAGLVIYGLCSLGLRVAREVTPQLLPGSAVDRLPDLAWPGWSVLLSAAALLGAIGVAVHQRYWQPMSPGRRWVWGPLVAASVALLGLALVRPAFLEHATWKLTPAESMNDAALPSNALSSDVLSGAVISSDPLPGDLLPGDTAGALPSNGGMSAPSAPDGGAPLAETSPRLAQADAAPPEAPAMPRESIADAGVQPIVRESEPPTVRPMPLMSLPVAPVAPAAPIAPTRPSPSPTVVAPAPGDLSEASRARAIAPPGRSSELADAVRTLERLLAQSPDRANDPMVRSTLSRAALTAGEPSDEAFRVMSTRMGSKGPDLLYDLMLGEPVLAERAKYQLRRFRVRKQFTPALAIAYDLRFSTNCGSRYSLLDRANEVGDQRSIETLSALLGKPEKCGGPVGLPCLPHCQRESIAFARSIESIAKRLRAAEREARAK
jgi:tRNA A-37 threonylcarbamoyl transferase component Bud32